MIKMTYKGQEGYFIPEHQKEQLDKVLKALFSKDNVEVIVNEIIS